MVLIQSVHRGELRGWGAEGLEPALEESGVGAQPPSWDTGFHISDPQVGEEFNHKPLKFFWGLRPPDPPSFQARASPPDPPLEF